MRKSQESAAKACLERFYEDPREATFLPLYERTRALVYTLCFRILRDEVEARDAFQSTYCRLLAVARSLHEKRGERGEQENPRDAVTVYRLAVREAQSLRQRRARRRRKEVAMDSSTLSDARRGPDEEAAARQLREKVDVLVSTLPERYRLPVLLHYFHGLSYGEIASILGRPVGTIASSIRRGLKKLDPLLRRAGLGESAAILGTLAGTAQLLSPPDALAASTVFAGAKQALTAQAAVTAAGGVTSATVGTFVGKTLVGISLMKTKTAGVALLIAAALVGVGTVGVLRSDRGPERPEPIAGEQVAAIVEPAGSPPSGVATPVPVTESMESEAEEIPQVVESTSIFGTVWLAENEPASGAEVMVLGDQYHYKEVRADEDGRFQVAGLRGDETSLRGALGRYRGHATIEVAENEASGPHDLYLERTLAVMGVVRDQESGEPIAGAEVGKMFTHKTIADDEGRYELGGLVRPGGYREVLKVSAAGFASAVVDVDCSSDVDIVRNFELESGAEVLVRVVDIDGQPVEGARLSTVIGGRFYETGIETDVAGEAWLDGVSRAGTQRLQAAKKGYRAVAGAVGGLPRFQEGEATGEAEIRLERFVEEVSYCVGRVTDAAGKPLAGMDVRSRFTDTTRHERRPRTRTGPDGRYRLAFKNPWAGCNVVVDGPGFAPQAERGIRPGTEAEPAVVDFVLEPGAPFEGVVVGRDGNPVPAARIVIYWTGYDVLGQNAETATDVRGRFRVDEAPPGTARVVIHAEGFARSDQTVPVDEEARFVLQVVGVIRGRVVEKVTGRPVEDIIVKASSQKNYSGGFLAGEALHAPGGRFTVRKLEYGTPHAVRVEAGSFLPAVVENVVVASLADAEEVLFELEKGQPLRGRVLRAGGGSFPDVLVVHGFMNGPLHWGRLEDPGYDWAVFDKQPINTGPDGSFEFLEGSRKGTLLVTAPGHVPVRIDPADRGAHTRDDELVVALETGASISGTFTLQGVPQADATIRAWNGEGHGPATTDAGGGYVLDGLPPGSHSLTASAPPYAVTRNVSLEAREALTTHLGHDLGVISIRGGIFEGEQTLLRKVSISFEPQFAWEYTRFAVTTEDDGAYRFRGLRPGSYKVTISGNIRDKWHHSERTLEIQGDQVEDFRL